MLATAIDLGHHARVPDSVIGKIKPRAQQILDKLLTYCSPQKPQVWIDQGALGKKLGIHRDTVGEWVRRLVKTGYLIFLGYRHDGRRKRYEVNYAKLLEEKEERPKKIAHDCVELNKEHIENNDIQAEKPGRRPGKTQCDVRSFYRTINRVEEPNIKEQTAVVVFSKKEFSSNEKIALKQKLKEIGLYKHSIEKIISKHSTEDINNQIAHLQQVVERGGDIKNPASWLISAIEKKYQMAETGDKKALEEDKEAAALREAAIVAQEAKSQLMEGKLHEAKEIATKSLLVAENTLAKAVLEEANQTLERAEKIERARALVSLEQQQLIRQEEEQRKLKEMRRWWDKGDAQLRGSAFFKTAVEALVDARLLASV